MKVKITGLSDAILVINSLKVNLQGRTYGFFEVNEDQLNELNLLKNRNLVSIENLEPVKNPEPIIETPKIEENIPTNIIPERKKCGRPKKSINSTPKPSKTSKTSKKKAEKLPYRSVKTDQKTTTIQCKSDQQKVKEAEKETEKERSEVVIATNDFQPKKIRMKNSFANDMPDNDPRTKDSREAMKLLEDEEKKPTDKIDDSKLMPEEQLGRKAIISDHGTPKEEEMKRSCVPGADKVKNIYIDINGKEITKTEVPNEEKVSINEPIILELNKDSDQEPPFIE